MGKPAARLGDMTIHGGIITMGCPTVLIGGMPAARMGDMHLCPMVTPAGPAPVPHVGMQIILGSTGVLIGKMPAARMGDIAICAGPPDTIAMGCPTVLIGEVGQGRGGSGSAAAPSVGSGAAVKGAIMSAVMSKIEPQPEENESHFLDITFQDKTGKLIAGEPYSLEFK